MSDDWFSSLVVGAPISHDHLVALGADGTFRPAMPGDVAIGVATRDIAAGERVTYGPYNTKYRQFDIVRQRGVRLMGAAQ